MPPRGRPTRSVLRGTTTSSRVKSQSTPVKISSSSLLELLDSPSKIKIETLEAFTITLEGDESDTKFPMRTINAAIASVSTLQKSGWTHANSINGCTRQNVEAISKISNIALRVLRRASAPVLDTERATISLCGRLISMQMYQSALSILQEAYPSVQTLYSAPATDTTFPCLPLPLNPDLMDVNVAIIIASFLVHVLQCLLLSSNTDEALIERIHEQERGFFLSWITLFPSASAKQIHSLSSSLFKATEQGSNKISAKLCFITRIYALRCILKTSQPGETPWVWKQTHSIAVKFLKESGPILSHTFRIFHSSMILCMESVQARDDFQELMSSPSFPPFQRVWTEVASRMGTPSDIDYVSSLSISDKHSPLSAETLFAILLATSNALKPPIHESTETSILERLKLATDQLQVYFKGPVQGDVSRLLKIIEQFRRLVKTIIDVDRDAASQSLLTAAEQSLHTVIQVNEKLLEQSLLTGESYFDLFSATVDSFLSLSKHSFKLKGPQTYKPSFELLNKAFAMLDKFITRDELSSLPRDRLWNLSRCISGAFWNFGSSLYQIGGWDHALPFICKSAELSKSLVEETRLCGKIDTETWSAFWTQVPKRFLLQASCYSKMNDRKNAYRAYCESIKCSMILLADSLVEQCSSTPADVVLVDPQHQSIYTAIERISYIGAAELFLGKDTSLRKLGEELRLPLPLVGLLLEGQIRALERSSWKQEMQTAIFGIFDDVLAIYMNGYPVRYARVTSKQLEFIYHSQSQQFDVVVIAEAAIKRILSDNLEKDDCLNGLVPQCLVTLHLWMTFHCHLSGSEAIKSLIEHVDAADSSLSSIIGILSGKPKKQLINAPTGGAIGSKKENGRRTHIPSASATKIPSITAKSKTNVSVKKPRGQPLPPSKEVGKTGPIKPPRKEPDESQLLQVDDLRSFLSLLNSACSLYRSLGLFDRMMRLLEMSVTIAKIKVIQSDFYCRSLISLAHEHSRLGMRDLAFSLYKRALDGIKTHPVADDIRLLFLLKFSAFLATVGNIDESTDLFNEASELATNIDWQEEKSKSLLDRVITRIQRVVYTAMACNTVSLIFQSSGKSAVANTLYLQSLRLWNSAIDMTKRLQPESVSTTEKDPFNMMAMTAALPGSNEAQKLPDQREYSLIKRFGYNGVNWILAEGLSESMVQLARYHFLKGNGRDSEYFSSQTQELAVSLHSPLLEAHSLCMRTEISICLGELTQAEHLLAEAEGLHHQSSSTRADVLYLKGRISEMTDHELNAKTLFGDAILCLEQFNDKIFFPSEMHDISLSKKESPMPVLQAKILRHHIWLLRETEYQQLLHRLERLPSQLETEAERNFLMSKLLIHKAHSHLRSELALSSILESTISSPLAVSTISSKYPQRFSDVVEMFDSAEDYLWSFLTQMVNRGFVGQIRQVALSLASIVIIRGILVKRETINSNGLAVTLIDLSAAAGLRRDLMESVEIKLRTQTLSDDNTWPSIENTETAAPLAPPKQSQSVSRVLFAPRTNPNDKLLKYWFDLRQRYNAVTFDRNLRSHFKDFLPHNWTVINICVSEDGNSLFITRQQPKLEPLLFCVPLARPSRMDNQDSNVQLTFEAALQEMQDIIDSCTQNGKRAAELLSEGKELRAEWWSERRALDTRLSDLLENIEFCWLGGFKAILEHPKRHSKEALSIFYRKISSIFKKFSRQTHKQDPNTLDKTIIECFASLSPKCRKEEIEDLVYFILDSYQYTGHEVSFSDVDIDQVCTDITAVLEEFAALTKETSNSSDQHLFLVLDKRVQGLPWESIPTLRGRSISRIPSLSFLIDRLELSRVLSEKPPLKPSDQYQSDGFEVDPRRVYYVLNPGGDLSRTEAQFSPWLQGMKKLGWSGVIGRAPTEMEMISALEKNDLFIYFGHGGGEQYIRGSKVRSLLRCPATMLWGCSSGFMKEAGQFDRTGTPYNYLLGGCPSLVVNLWDVTDKDIDKFAQAVFNKLGLDSNRVKRSREERSIDSISVVEAVATSRDVCKLKYLTGAAPVVYGIPIYL